MLKGQFWNGLEGPDARAVIAAATTRRFSSDTIIYEQGSPAVDFFLLSRGRARYFYLTPDGRKTLLHWIGPGAVLGVATLLQEPTHYRVGAEAVQESSLLTWDRQVIRALFDRYPRLSQNAFSVVMEYLDWYIATHAALSSDTAQQRLASVLTTLADAMGRDVSGGVELDLTNEELASAANVTPFTASRIVSAWQTARVVTKHRGRIVVHSAKRLF